MFCISFVSDTRVVKQNTETIPERFGRDCFVVVSAYRHIYSHGENMQILKLFQSITDGDNVVMNIYDVSPMQQKPMNETAEGINTVQLLVVRVVNGVQTSRLLGAMLLFYGFRRLLRYGRC